MNIVSQIAQDLALRAPQRAALARLDGLLTNIADLRAPLSEIEAEASAVCKRQAQVGLQTLAA